MGIKEIASNLVAKVESLVAQEGGDTGKAGKIDTEKEISIFSAELQKQNIGYKDAKEIWGLVKDTDKPTANAPARAQQAPQTRASSDGNKFIINIHNEINWYININIDNTMSDALIAEIEKLISQGSKNFKGLIDFLKEKFDELNRKNQDGRTIILAAIKELYNKYEGLDYTKLEEILQKISNDFGYDLDQLRRMVEELVKNSYEVLQMMGLQLDQLKVNNEQMAQINEAILKLSENFTKFSDEQIKHLNKLIELVVQGNMKLDQFLEILNAIKDDTGEIRDTNLKILEAIGNLDKSLVEQMTNMYNMILQQGDRTNEKLEQFLELLKNMQGAIDKLGNTVVENITNVVKAINDKKFDVGDVNVNLSGFEAMFEKLLAEVQKGNQINAEGFNAVLKKLGELIQVGEIDLTNIETLLNDIKVLTKENGDSLKNILLNQDTMKMFLENFKNELLEQEKIEEGQLDTIIELLMKKINDGHGCDVNGAELMAKLQEILEAIINKKCECDCDHSVDDDSNDESIIEDLDKIFMARSRNNMTGIDNVTGDSTGTVTVNGQEYVVGKKYMVDGQVCIANPGGLFTIAGVKVAEPD